MRSAIPGPASLRGAVRGTGLALSEDMVIELMLVAGEDDDTTTVSTTIQLNTTDPRWPIRLVDAVTIQAQEGARRLRDQLAAERAISADDHLATAFVPLAEVVPAAQARR